MAEDRRTTREMVIGIPPDVKEHFEAVIRKSGAEIIPPKEYVIPDDYEFQNIKEGGKTYVNKAINVLKDYLTCPIISDNFSSHEQRRAWRASTYKSVLENEGIERADQFDSYLKYNKMKRNKISGVFGYTDILEDYTDLPEELANNLMSAIRDTLPNEKADPMEGPTTPEKIEKVNKISDAVVDVLNYFGKK